MGRETEKKEKKKGKGEIRKKDRLLESTLNSTTLVCPRTVVWILVP